MSSEEVNLNSSTDLSPDPDPTPKRKSRADDFFTECQYYGLVFIYICQYFYF